MSATRIPYPSAQPVYATAEQWRDRCLLDDRGLFSDDSTATLTHAEELIRAFVGHPELDKTDFLTRLQTDLVKTSTGAVQLAAELLYIHLLITRTDSVSGSEKRAIITRVLGFASGTAPMPDDLDKVLDTGLVRTGTGYHTHRWALYEFLVEAFAALKRLDPAERRALLDDPDACVELLNSVHASPSAAIQKYSIEHLLFPDTFAPVVTDEDRAAILRNWGHLTDMAGVTPDAGTDTPPVASDIDPTPPAPTASPASPSRRLAAIHHALAAQTGEPDGFVNMWRSPWHWQWAPVSEPWAVAAAWLLWWKRRVDVDATDCDSSIENARRLTDLRNQVDVDHPVWTGLLTMFFTTETTLVNYRTYGEFLTWVRSNTPAARSCLLDLWNDPSTGALDRFQEALPADVLASQGARLSVSSTLHMAETVRTLPPWRSRYIAAFTHLTGALRPEPTASDSEVYDHFLALLDSVIDIAARQGVHLRDRLDAQSLLYTTMLRPAGEVGTREDAIASQAWRTGRHTPPPAVASPEDATGDICGIYSDEDLSLTELADRLYLDSTFLETIRTLLEDRRQVIFTGIPGTGKTYVARAFAEWFAGSPSRVQVVHFHPSYGYEDFVEGYRPREEGGVVLRPGPLRAIETEASLHPGETFVLVIDELNRGDIGRAFGELYYLLEYRNESAQLMYSTKPFTLPKNLHIIGTINSADRSIALTDSALRRRFSFVDFDPRQGAVSGMLNRYLAANTPSMRWVADLVTHANAVIADPLYLIGPSHFMRPDLTESLLPLIWNHDVLPTVCENLTGHDEVLARLSLDALRAQIAPPGKGDAGSM